MSTRERRGIHRAPFQAWFGEYVDQAGGVDSAALMLGVDGAAVRRMARDSDRTTDYIQLRAADRYFVAADEPHQLAILYPQDDLAMDDRWCSTCVETTTVNDDLLCPWCESETDRILPVVEFDRWYEDKPRSEATA